MTSNHMKVNIDKSHLILSGNSKLTSNTDNLIMSEKKQLFRYYIH